MVISECRRCHKTLYYDPPREMCERCRVKPTWRHRVERVVDMAVYVAALPLLVAVACWDVVAGWRRPH